MAKVLLSCPPSPKTAPWPLDSPTAVGHRERWREKTWANQAERPGKGIVINSIPCRFAKHASQHPIQKKTHSPWTHSTHDAVIFFEFLVIFLIGPFLHRTCPWLVQTKLQPPCVERTEYETMISKFRIFMFFTLCSTVLKRSFARNGAVYPKFQ